MIGYFVAHWDPSGGSFFDAYEAAFAKIVNQRLAGKAYGDDLKLILVEYYVEGKFGPPVTKAYRVQGYRKKEKGLGVIVFVARSFQDKSEMDKRQFIIDTTFEALRLVRIKMERLGHKNIDWERLGADMNECAAQYVKLGDLVKFAWPEE